MKKLFAFIVALVLLASSFSLGACTRRSPDPSDNRPGSTNSDGTNNGGTNNGDDISDEVSVPSGDMFTDADKNAKYDEEGAVTISLSGSSATTSSSDVTVSNGLITISKEGSYIVSGNGINQTIVVDAKKAKVRLVLNGATIKNSSYAGVYVKDADKVFVIVKGENSLIVTGDFKQKDSNTVDGAIFTKDDMTIQGDGSLKINSSKHGIVGKDDIKITGGDITVTADSHGIQANDSVRMAAAKLVVKADKDGIQVKNGDDETKGFFYLESGSAKITSGYDGVDASNTVTVSGGTLEITAGGGSNKSVSANTSTKGIKATNDILISSGTVTVNSSDDCIHSNDSIEIAGGTLTLSSGDDGVHADTSIIVSGGTVNVTKSYEGLEAQNIAIKGGKINIKASDDGLNAAGGNDGSSVGGRPGQGSFNTSSNAFITISGGEIYVNASGDGVDSNGNLTVSGGTTIVEGPTDNGNGALDYDGTATISGGTFVAIGSSGMAMNFSSATQGSVLVNGSSQSAGTKIVLSDGSGNEIFSMTATKTYSSVLISSPDLIKDKSYTLKAGTASTSITLSSLIYGSGSGAGDNRPGGNTGGPGGPGGR